MAANKRFLKTRCVTMKSFQISHFYSKNVLFSKATNQSGQQISIKRQKARSIVTQSILTAIVLLHTSQAALKRVKCGFFETTNNEQF